MYKEVKYIKGLGLLILPLLALFVSSCENDLNKVKEISSNEKGIIISPTVGVDMIYSDSARVKIRILSPLMLDYQTKKPYKVMPKGVKIIQYDNNAKEEANIIADTGIMYDDKKLIEFRKNVVGTNVKGETFKSDQLFWDQVTKKVYSHKPVQFVMSDGNVMSGDEFESDDQFLKPVITHSTGIFHVDEKATE